MGWIRTTALLRRQNESNSSYEWGKKPESVEKDLYDLERNFESAFTYDERSGVEVEKKVQQLSTTHPNIMVMNRWAIGVMSNEAVLCVIIESNGGPWE